MGEMKTHSPVYYIEDKWKNWHSTEQNKCFICPMPSDKSV